MRENSFKKIFEEKILHEIIFLFHFLEITSISKDQSTRFPYRNTIRHWRRRAASICPCCRRGSCNSHSGRSHLPRVSDGLRESATLPEVINSECKEYGSRTRFPPFKRRIAMQMKCRTAAEQEIRKERSLVLSCLK